MTVIKYLVIATLWVGTLWAIHDTILGDMQLGWGIGMSAFIAAVAGAATYLKVLGKW